MDLEVEDDGKCGTAMWRGGGESEKNCSTEKQFFSVAAETIPRKLFDIVLECEMMVLLIE